MNDIDALTRGEVPGNPGDFAVRVPVPQELVDDGTWRANAVTLWRNGARLAGCTAGEPRTVNLLDLTWDGMPVAEVVGPARAERPLAGQSK